MSPDIEWNCVEVLWWVSPDVELNCIRGLWWVLGVVLFLPNYLLSQSILLSILSVPIPLLVS